jgi:hypothetical protein
MSSAHAALAELAPGGRTAIEKIAVPGFCSSVSSGNPALPCKLIYLALPPDADKSSVAVVPSYATTTLPGSYDIGPALATASSNAGIEWGTGKSIIAGRNALVYARNEFYPREQVRLVEVGRLRSWKIAVVEFWPYAFNPSTGELRAVNTSKAELSFTRKQSVTVTPDPVALEMDSFVENHAEAEAWYGGTRPSSFDKLRMLRSLDRAQQTMLPQAAYTVITTSAIVSASTALSDFVNFQSARGLGVKVATELDWGGGTGDIAAERIRAWLKTNYLALGVQYVLLIGNPNPSTGNVPMKMLWPRRWSSSYKEAPSDYYYSDLTGNWDLDGDGYAGEEPDDFGPGGIDRIPEVYVGRIPVYDSSAATLDSILRKTMSYGSNSPGQWSREFLLAMVPMDTDTPSYQLGEQITNDFVRPLDLGSDRVYGEGYGISPQPEHFPCSYDMVQNEWMNGAGLVFWMTHGSTNTAGSVFSSSRCAYLDDSKPSIVYMASCSNGKPEDSGSLGYCALAKGAVSTLSASRVSWYYLGETDFTNSDSIGGLGYQYARFLLAGGEAFGRAAMDARLAGPVGIWPNHLVYNLYGDPSLAYRIPRAAASVPNVAGAKLASDGEWVRLDGVVLSRMGDGPECFVQDADRCAGIRVSGQWGGILSLQPGSGISVVGCLATENGMRVLKQAEVTPSGTSVALSPLGMSARSVKSPKSIGLLVVVWGRVLSATSGGFTISGINKKIPFISVICRGSATVPPLGAFVRLVGISTPDGVAIYQAGDVVVTVN